MDQDKRLIEFFDRSLAMHPEGGPQAVGWSDLNSQNLRFEILLQLTKFEHDTVLDVGCGLGDMYSFIKKNNLKLVYKGIDMHPQMIKKAMQKFGKELFLLSSLEEHEGNYDYVLVSGAFNLELADNYRFLEDKLLKMKKIAKKGIAFNLLSEYTPFDARYYDLCYYEVSKVFALCKEHFDKVVIRHDYLPNDMTLYLYK